MGSDRTTVSAQVAPSGKEVALSSCVGTVGMGLGDLGAGGGSASVGEWEVTRGIADEASVQIVLSNELVPEGAASFSASRMPRLATEAASLWMTALGVVVLPEAGGTKWDAKGGVVPCRWSNRCGEAGHGNPIVETANVFPARGDPN